VNVGDGPAENFRSPDLARASLLKQPVSGSVAFHSDCVPIGPRIRNGEIEAKRPAIACLGWVPPLRLQELLDGLGETIVFLISTVLLGAFLGHQSIKHDIA
jgi:hypothetical protein